MPLKAIFLLLISGYFAQFAHSHGLNKPGPHGGFIKMPGTFHTELVPLSENEWKIYLLDENIKNPTVKNSSISGAAKLRDGQTPLTCKVVEDFFLCTLQATGPKETPTKLQFESKRSGGPLGVSIYQLPLDLK